MDDVVRMFPLGSVLMPGGVMPLHIFEPRYLTMISEVLQTGEPFGIVLIERGRETGGGDTRFRRGTLARIARSEIFEDNRMVIVTVGTERFDVAEWLDDAPYPRARIATLAEEDSLCDGDRDALRTELQGARRALNEIYALAAALGYDIESPRIDVTEDLLRDSWELCSVAPIGPIDQQQLLDIDDPIERTRTLRETLEAAAGDLGAQMESK